MAATREFHNFLALPAELQIAIIQQINDDRTLFRLLAANRYMWSLFKGNVNTIFRLRVPHLTDLTNQPVTPLVLQRADAYLQNKDRARPYVEEKEENHTPLSYMIFQGFEKTAAAYLSAMTKREEMRHKARHGYNLLSLAILSCNPAMVDLVLAQQEASQLLDEADAYGDKSIHIATRVGNRQILKSLVSHPSFQREFINSRGNYSYCPLANFCHYHPYDNVDFLQDLISYGAKVDDVAKQYSSFISDPIYLAVAHKKPKVAMFLLGFKKHNINRFVSSPYVILGTAIQSGYKDIVKLLALECHVEIERTVDPEKSQLIAAMHFCDLELMRIVFQIESGLYERVPVKKYQCAGHEFNLPVFADYLLGAMNVLTHEPTSKETFEMYNLLVEFGFNTSMVWHSGGANVFHYIAPNLPSFIGETEESITFAEKIIDDLLNKDSSTNFRNKVDDRGVLPVQLLPKGEYQCSTAPFEERIKVLFAMARKKLAEASQAKEAGDTAIDEYEPKRLPVHDDANRCTLF